MKEKAAALPGPIRLAARVFPLLMGTLFLLGLPLSAGYAGMADAKCALFLALAVPFVSFCLIAWAELRLVRALPGRQAPPLSPAELCALAYLALTALSAALSPYKVSLLGGGRHNGLVTIALYAGLFLVLCRAPSLPRWSPALFGGALLVPCLLGALQLTGGNPLGLYPAGMDYYDAWALYAGQFLGTTGNVDFCAAVLSMGAGYFSAALALRRERWEAALYLPLCAAVFALFAIQVDSGAAALFGGLLLGLPLLAGCPGAAGRLPSILGAVLLSAGAARSVVFSREGIALVLSRTALGAAAAGGLLLLLSPRLRPRLDRADPRCLRRRLLVIALVLLVMVVLVLALWSGWPDGALREAHELLHGRWDDSFGSSRLGIWRQTLAAAKERPLLGSGPDTLGFRGLAGFSRYNEHTGTVVTSSVDAAHNEYLNILAEQGAFALLAYGGLLLLSLLRWWREPSRDTALGGMAALCYLVWALFGISVPITAPYLWMALAALNRH